MSIYISLSRIYGIIYKNDELIVKINKELSDMKQSFQDGCKKIVDKLTALSYPPEDPQGPDEINIQIQNIYDKRYADGYKDGVNKTSANAKIVYTYHKHTSSCYIPTHVHTDVCKAYYAQCGEFGGRCQVDHNDIAFGTCSRCGRDCTGMWSGIFCHYPDESSGWYYICNNLPLNSSGIGCGKSESTIEKATITFG